MSKRSKQSRGTRRAKHTNCKPGCGCTSLKQFKSNLLAGEAREIDFDGAPHLVVPVIMAKANVVMNEALLPLSEFNPEAWDGVPVTISHPVSNGENVSATSPDQFANRIGHIFNTHVDGVNLKAEAYINIERAEDIAPGLVQSLLDGVQIDVSTGYFADDEVKRGAVNGRMYNFVSHNISPNHLALLPDEMGACSWADGCGIRANRESDPEMKRLEAMINKAVQKSIKSHFAPIKKLARNLRGDSDDRRQIIADLLASDETPYTPADEDSLKMMSDTALLATRDSWFGKPADDEEIEANDDREDAIDDEDKLRFEKKKANSSNIFNLDAIRREALKMHVDDRIQYRASKMNTRRKSADGTTGRYIAEQQAKFQARYPTEELLARETRVNARRAQGAAYSNEHAKTRAVQSDQIDPPLSLIETIQQRRGKK